MPPSFSCRMRASSRTCGIRGPARRVQRAAFPIAPLAPGLLSVASTAPSLLPIALTHRLRPGSRVRIEVRLRFRRYSFGTQRTLMPTPPKTSTAGIVAAARDLLAKRGVEALTMQSVGERVGVRGPSLYKHFADRAGVAEGGRVNGGRGFGRSSQRRRTGQVRRQGGPSCYRRRLSRVRAGVARAV